MREIGKNIVDEQSLTGLEINFLIIISHAIFVAFGQNKDYSMSELSDDLGLSRTTFYKYMHLVVKTII